MTSPRRIGPFQVAPVGVGCMNFSHAYGEPPPFEAAERRDVAPRVETT